MFSTHFYVPLDFFLGEFEKTLLRENEYIQDILHNMKTRKNINLPLDQNIKYRTNLLLNQRNSIIEIPFLAQNPTVPQPCQMSKSPHLENTLDFLVEIKVKMQ